MSDNELCETCDIPLMGAHFGNDCRIVDIGKKQIKLLKDILDQLEKITDNTSYIAEGS